MNANAREFMIVKCRRRMLSCAANPYYTVIPAKAGIHG